MVGGGVGCLKERGFEGRGLVERGGVGGLLLRKLWSMER